MNKHKKSAPAGIFESLVNSAAFIDTVVLGIAGIRRKRSGAGIADEANLAIGGPNSFYARCIRARHKVSGNTLQLRYGRMRDYAKLSPFVLTVWAHSLPVSCANVLLVLDHFFRRGYRAVVSSVELTFDTRGTALWQFGRDLCTRAKVSEGPHTGENVTVYVGGPRSSWQVRIYQKTPSIVRVEFVLRSTFLRAHGIRRPQDLLLLRNSALFRMVRFRKVNHAEGYALPKRVREPWETRGLALPPAMPASIVERELRRARVDPRRWVVPAEHEKLLRSMQRLLIW